MILYFSATGNSLWVARQLASAFGLSAQPLSAVTEVFKSGEPLFLVFPVHSWGPALVVVDFIKRMSLTGYEGQPIYAVCVCGDDCGRTDKIIAKQLRRRGMILTAAFSVSMPNNYILLPGFDVDDTSVASEKLLAAETRVAAIVEAVKNGEGQGLYHAGALPRLKSAVYPLFRRYARWGNSFYVTDACVACGKCMKICPVHIIIPDADGRPVWNKKGCTQCSACIHRCPVRAIEYGKISRKKGRYHHPDCP